jgi:murein DD-endopeptidase MepM/ murein hydrolase activator NlpD
MGASRLTDSAPQTRREARNRQESARAIASSRPARAPHRSIGRQILSVAAMAFALLLAVGVSIPANAFGDASTGSTAGAAASLGRAQDVSVVAPADGTAGSRDGFSVTLPPPPKPKVVLSGAGEPSVSGVSFISAPGPVRWPTDTSPQIGHGVSNSHHGQDLLIANGTPVHAIADGVVVVSGLDGSLGQEVVIQSTIAGHTVVSLYGHMQVGSQAVSAGQTVTMGQVVGLVGSSGAATGFVLYLRILQDGALCDTVTYIAGNPAGGAAPH